MTTVRELSERLGVSKTAVLKYAKEELKLKTEPRKSLQLSANQCAVIANHFSGIEQGKREQTENLSANQCADGLQMCADEVVSLQIENAALKERIAGLERENSLLRERIEKADEALEREQMQARGFWSRLGQKLLGEGGAR